MEKISIKTGASAVWGNAAARLAAIMLAAQLLTGCHGLLVDSRTAELNGLGRAFVRIGNLSDHVGLSQSVTVDGPRAAPAEVHHGE